MTTSQNGWPASPDPSAIGIKPFVVAGRSFPGGVKGGAVATVLRYTAAQYHLRVESLYYGDTDKDDWGYFFRHIAGSSVITNHGSGTAIDVNATTNPQGVAHSHTYAQELTIRAILRECGGAVHWGRDFPRPDPMHFEIHGGSAAVSAVARRLVSPSWFHRDLYLTGSDKSKWMRGDDIKMVQRRLGFTGRSIDGVYGPVTRNAVIAMEARLVIPKTGKVTKSRAFYIGSPA